MRIIIAAIMLLLLTVQGTQATVYLVPVSTGCSDGATTYNPTTNICVNGSDTAYTLPASFSANITIGGTSYIRAGTYGLAGGNATSGTGTLHLSRSGSSGSPTKVLAYPGEERLAIIAADTNKMQYNPNPSETTYTFCDTTNRGIGQGNCYYPNPAIYISGEYIEVGGVKTYGQLQIQGGSSNYLHGIKVHDCDLGGGGPTVGQGFGQVIFIQYALGWEIYNNMIHHSVWGQSSNNGATFMQYSAADGRIYNNTFYAGYGSDIMLKDMRYVSGMGYIYIYNNLFLHSDINPANAGFRGVMQYPGDGYYVHHNVFIDKGQCISYEALGTIANGVYNNTCIRSSSSDGGIGYWGGGSNLENRNNIIYGSTSYYAKFGDSSHTATSTLSDYNLYYNGSGGWYINDGAIRNTSAFATWQGYGYDTHSLITNPNFINASGTTAADFKRSSYTENFTGSPYSTKAGAYETGSEQIGVNWSGGVVITDASVNFTSRGGAGNNVNPSSSVLFYANPQITGVGVSGTQGMGNIMGIPAGEAATFVNIIMN